MKADDLKKSALMLMLWLPVAVAAQKFPELAPTPPMGWNSWNTFGVHIDENLIKEMSGALISSGMLEAGFNYIVIDDGWESMSRDAHGALIPDPARFPSGMKALGDYLHSKGFKFGIHNCAGTKTCSGFPGGRGHEFEDARTYASWGVDFLKYDWCEHGTANAEETYKTMSDALHAAGRPIVFSICEWGNNKPWLWGPKIAQLWRTTGDITDCYDCQDVYAMGWKYILKLQMGLEPYAGPEHWNAPDMLEVGNAGLSLAESRSHFSLWCMLAAPLMAGNDARKMPDEIRGILTNRELIAVDQDPLGKEGFQFMEHPGKEIWAKELSAGSWAVCFFNNSESTVRIRVKWENLSFLKGVYGIRDLWQKESLGTTAKDYTGDLAPHDVTVFRLAPVREQP